MKILIVDDEKIERSGIKMLLKNEQINAEIQEAKNGKEALQYILDNPVDILLTDVRMPHMNGIELITEVHKLERGILNVIFSGCNEFEYAKQAIKLGVADYILKPVDPDEFSKTMRRVIEKYEKQQEEIWIKEKTDETVKDHILYMIANKSTIAEVEAYNKGLISLDFLKQVKRILLIEFNNDFFGGKGNDFKLQIEKLVPECFHYLNLNPQQSVLLFSTQELGLMNIAKRFCQEVYAKYNETCYVAISSEVKKIQDISNRMDELEILMENRFYSKGWGVFYSEMQSDLTEMLNTDDDLLMKQMKQDIKMKDMSNLREHFARFCEKYQQKKGYAEVYIKFLFSNLLKDFYEHLPNTKELELNEEINRLYHATEFEEVKSLVNLNIDRLEKVFGLNPQMAHREIEIVKRYIYDHYDQEISIDQLGELVFMAPSYLSAVFKKETGQNLSKFIKAYRMEIAKEMLETSMTKIVDISVLCGYQNVSYFCSSFREYFGMSPQKFRESGED